MKYTYQRAKSLFSVLALISFCFFVTACGDSDSDEFVNTTGNGGNTNFIGRFLGAATIGNNQGSVLTLNTTGAGQASGTLQVNAAVVPQTVNFPTGTFPANGSVNLDSGAFSLTGTIPNLGPFSISGIVPTGSNQGTFTITINNQTFQGVIQDSVLGIPNPPTNNGGTSNLIQGGTLSDFVFTPDGSYNGVNPPVTGTSTISGNVGPGQDGTESATFVLSETAVLAQSVAIRTFVVSIVAPQGESLVTGQTYQLASSPTSNGAIIALSTAEGTTVVDGWSLVQGTTGQATITARDANSITMDFSFSNVGPNSEVANNPSEGTFSTSGTLVGNFASTL